MTVVIFKHAVYALAGGTLLLSATAALAKDAYCYGVRNNTSIYMTQIFPVPANIAESALPNDYERLLRNKYKPDGAYQIKCMVDADPNVLERGKKKIEQYIQANRLGITLTAAPVNLGSDRPSVPPAASKQVAAPDAGSGTAAAPVESAGTPKQAATPAPGSPPASTAKAKPENQPSSPGSLYCHCFLDRKNPGIPQETFYVSPVFSLSPNTRWPDASEDIKQQWKAEVTRHDSRASQGNNAGCTMYNPEYAAQLRANRDEKIQQMIKGRVTVHQLDWTYRR